MLQGLLRVANGVTPCSPARRAGGSRSGCPATATMSSIINQIGIFFTYRVLKLSIMLFEKNLMPDFITRWVCFRGLRARRAAGRTSYAPCRVLRALDIECVPVLSQGMRRLLETNLVPKNVEDARSNLMSYYESLRTKPVAMNTAEANEQHYELPPEFFLPIMGNRLKYSACIFNKGTHDDDINKAEEDALAQVTHTHAHAHTHARPRARARTHAHAHTHTRTRTHTHAHTCTQTGQGTRGTARWDGDSGIGLWLGFSVLVHGRTLSQVAHHCRV